MDVLLVISAKIGYNQNKIGHEIRFVDGIIDESMGVSYKKYQCNQLHSTIQLSVTPLTPL